MLLCFEYVSKWHYNCMIGYESIGIIIRALSRHFLLRVRDSHQLNFQGPQQKFEGSLHWNTLPILQFLGVHWDLSKNFTRAPLDFQGPGALTLGLPRALEIYSVHCTKLTLVQPTWSAYLYHFVFLIEYPYSFFFLIWYPYTLVSLYGNIAHCSGYSIAMGCYGLSMVPRSASVTSQWYDCYCITEYADVSKTIDNTFTMPKHGNYRLLINRFYHITMQQS